jgi:hypothetical protein
MPRGDQATPDRFYIGNGFGIKKFSTGKECGQKDLPDRELLLFVHIRWQSICQKAHHVTSKDETWRFEENDTMSSSVIDFYYPLIDP